VVSDCNDFFCTKDQLISTEGAATILDVLDNVVKVLEVFPDKVADSWVVGYAFFETVGEVVSPSRTADQNIVDIRYCSIRYFRLQDVGNVVMENRNGVSPAHRQGDKAKQSKWGLECGEVV